MKTNRRNFLKSLGIGSGLAVAGPFVGAGLRSRKTSFNLDRKIYIDKFVEDWFEYSYNTLILGNNYKRWRADKPKYFINGRLVKREKFNIHIEKKMPLRPFVFEKIFHSSRERA